MSAVPVPILASSSPLRPLNILHDLPEVASLVEVCFADTMDEEGRNYVQQMRRAGRDNTFLRWAAQAVETVSMPLSGYVWEEHGKICGNVSLIPYRYQHESYYLIANVAVHPDYRRQGIGRSLTAAAAHHARDRRAHEIWLHVRDDNPGAIALYQGLGFVERLRRTNWRQTLGGSHPRVNTTLPVSRRRAYDWKTQQEWLGRLYPNLMNWYQSLPLHELRPGLVTGMTNFFLEVETRNWVARGGSGAMAILNWRSFSNGHPDRLLPAVPAEGADQALLSVLEHACNELAPWRQVLGFDFPAQVYREAILQAGFLDQRTLLWMRLEETPAA
jgi:ribosomal protein S18 acetylase RimI-like enzyme